MHWGNSRLCTADDWRRYEHLFCVVFYLNCTQGMQKPLPEMDRWHRHASHTHFNWFPLYPVESTRFYLRKCRRRLKVPQTSCSVNNDLYPFPAQIEENTVLLKMRNPSWKEVRWVLSCCFLLRSAPHDVPNIKFSVSKHVLCFLLIGWWACTSHITECVNQGGSFPFISS